jgi:hypothetical protein
MAVQWHEHRRHQWLELQRRQFALHRCRKLFRHRYQHRRLDHQLKRVAGDSHRLTRAIQSVALLPDNSLQMLLAGDPGATYYVQSSTNLVNWSPLTNITLSSGTFSFIVTGLTNDAQRFFRARSGP